MTAQTFVSPPVSAAARSTMRANRGRDTGPELAIRSRLHRAGLRYRVDLPLPFDRRRRADLGFTRVGLYVFVDGCFWHGCPKHFVIPKTRTDFWVAKIESNRRRDRDTDDRLRELGATPLRIWEHTPAAVACDLIRATYFELAVPGRL
ncbi:T/G mismatch-specific endonuclease [Phycicoccus duodecadis]|uniref:T/G mismatch-specific endonuclease n=2 Tax=Phycicoccus duodecadis TaxID=173053 RepID=A0A2N3YMA3_9MICO|nr:T/G mismatch-specific endonuclease [Phycicoccus duodecadis]